MARLVRWPGWSQGPQIEKASVLCSTITWPPNGIRPGYGWFAVDNNIEGSFNQANIFVKSILAVANIYIPVLISFLPSLF